MATSIVGTDEIVPNQESAVKLTFQVDFRGQASERGKMLHREGGSCPDWIIATSLSYNPPEIVETAPVLRFVILKYG